MLVRTPSKASAAVALVAMAVLSLVAVLVTPETLPDVDDSLVRLSETPQGAVSQSQLHKHGGAPVQTANGAVMQLFSTEGGKPHTAKAKHAELIEGKSSAREHSHSEADESATAQLKAKMKAQHIEHMRETFRSKEERGHALVVKQRLAARRHYEQTRLQNELEVVSETSEVEQELPRNIEGLVKHFAANHALGNTKSHPFKEVQLRHAGRKYNKLRKRVMGLTDKLAHLEEQALDKAAQDKFEGEKRAAKAAQQRLKEDDEDKLSLAKLPDDVQAKLQAIQAEMMKKKKAAFKEEMQAKLRQDEAAAAEVVQEDEVQIAGVKKQLHDLVGDKYLDEASTTTSTEDDEAAVLVSVPLDADRTVPEGRGGGGAAGQESSVVMDPTEGHAVRLLAKEVALLEKQQAHLVDALTKSMAQKGGPHAIP
jgi:hypothetical protein